MSIQAMACANRLDKRQRHCRIVVAFCWIAVALAWLLERWPGESWWLTTLLVYGPQVILLAPVALAFAAAAIGRDRFSLKASALILFVVLFVFMGFNVAAPAKPGGGRRLVIAAWNVHHKRWNAARIKREVERLRADVVFLEEAEDPEWRRVFRGWNASGARGQWVLSRRRMSGEAKIRLGSGWRPGCQAQIRVGAQPVMLLDVHLVMGDPHQGLRLSHGGRRAYLRRTVQLRREQIAGIAQWATRQRTPFIIAGDFNTPPHAGPWRPLRPLASDAFAARGFGCGYTFHSRLPVWRIDYIWVSPAWRVLRAGTFGGRLSDHRGVWAEIELPRRTAQERGD